MSPESVNKLRRHRSRVDKDIADMDNRMAGRSKGRAETEETNKNIKHSMEDILQMYKHQKRTKAGQLCGSGVRESE